jgi:hypothetical protein
VQQNSDQSVQDLVGRLRYRLQKFGDGRPLADDTTLVAYRLNA